MPGVRSPNIKHQEQFDKLRDNLRAFPNLIVDAEDYELAAEYFNICRRHGIQGANTDFLICATANRRNYEIFTTDKDFIKCGVRALPQKRVFVQNTMF